MSPSCSLRCAALALHWSDRKPGHLTLRRSPSHPALSGRPSGSSDPGGLPKGRSVPTTADAVHRFRGPSTTATGRGRAVTTIRANCPSCGDVQLTAEDLTVRVCADDERGSYCFRCPDCQGAVAKEASRRIVDLLGEDAKGNIVGRHRSTGIGHPRFWDRARYYGEEQRLAAALDAAEATNEGMRA